MRYPALPALLGVLAVAVLAGACPTPANAAPEGMTAVAAPSSMENPHVDRIAPDALGSLVVTKYQKLDDDTVHGNGLPDPDIAQDHTPVSGVRYMVYRALLPDGKAPDLTTEAGWTALAKAPGEPRYSEPYLQDDETDSDGVARFDNLPVGAYWVVEDPATTRPGYDTGEPFLVTLPLTHPLETDHWLYTVYAYPKAQTEEHRFTMDLREAEARAPGDEISWIIEARIPTTAPTALRIADTLDGRLTHAGESVTIEPAGVPLQEGTHYRVRREAPFFPPGLLSVGHGHDRTTARNAGGTLTYEMTRQGLDLLSQHGGSQLAIVVRTEVRPAGTPESDLMEIGNAAHLYLDDATDPDLSAQAPPSKWGRLDIAVSEKCTAEPMVDGEYRLFRSKADATHGRNPLTVGGREVFTLDADGRIGLASLNASAWRDGIYLPESDWIPYYLAEAKTPTKLADGTNVKVAPLGEPVLVHVLNHGTDIDKRLVYRDPTDDCSPPDPPTPTPTPTPPAPTPPEPTPTDPPRPPVDPVPTGAKVAGAGGAAIALIAIGWLLKNSNRRGA